MKLSFNFKKKEAGLEVDAEGLISKQMDINAKKAGGKTRYQIRQEEKRKTMEMKHKQDMQRVYVGVGLMLGVALFALLIVILANTGII